MKIKLIKTCLNVKCSYMPVISPSLSGRHEILIPYPILCRPTVDVYYQYFDTFSYLFT